MFNEKTNYTSWSIQNDLLNISAQIIIDTIIKEINECGFFSVMCDEARCYRDEQMTICVRYTKDLIVYERFLRFINVSQKQDANALSTAIIHFFKTNKINVPVVAQAYDGASVMAGKFNGVQTKIKTEYPYAIYTHCMAHRINLVVLDMCKLVKETRIVFNCLESLYVYFSHPSNNIKFKEVQEELGIKKTLLTRLSDTRWNCRAKNCTSVKSNFKAIITVLKNEIDSSNNKDALQAIGILSILKKPSFFIHLLILEEVLQIINVLNTRLQNKGATLGSAINLIEGIIKTFESLRVETEFQKIWNNIINFAESNNLDLLTTVNDHCAKRQKKQPKNLNDFYVFTTTTMNSEPQNLNESNQTDIYHKSCTDYYQVIDCIVTNLKKRFSPESLKMASSIDSFHKLNYDLSKYFIEHYKGLVNVDVHALRSEMLVAKNCLTRTKLNFDLEEVKSVVDLKVYPNLYTFLSLSLTIPISSSTCERSFSAMRKIKNWLRTSMHQDRFSNASIIYIEKDIYCST
uniref:Zinc finger MYM-type protein 1 n=2 Tax=Schizaphis graminum TaxID=13262 RepID=A0A2S2PNG2_SCHGA